MEAGRILFRWYFLSLEVKTLLRDQFPCHHPEGKHSFFFSETHTWFRLSLASAEAQLSSKTSGFERGNRKQAGFVHPEDWGCKKILFYSASAFLNSELFRISVDFSPVILSCGLYLRCFTKASLLGSFSFPFSLRKIKISRCLFLYAPVDPSG